MIPSKELAGRICTICRKFKDSTNFHLRGDDPSHTKLRSKCIECLYGEGASKHTRRFPNAKFPGSKSASQRERNIFYKYGLALKDYDRVLKEQNNVCKICGKISADVRFGQLVVDHEHSTGKVRGLLCTMCNHGLGMFGDSMETILKAACYLEDSRNG